MENTKGKGTRVYERFRNLIINDNDLGDCHKYSDRIHKKHKKITAPATECGYFKLK